MIARINFGVNQIAERAGYDKMTTILDLHLRDGRTLSPSSSRTALDS
jgi:hypothetical protein